MSTPHSLGHTETELLRAPDTALYMITLDRIYEQGIHLPASMSKYHHRDLDEEDKMSMYYVGRSNLQDYLVIPEG